MVTTRNLWLLLPRQIRHFPADLGTVIGIVLVTCLSVYMPGVRGTTLQLLLGASFTLLVPGYAVTALLFPKAKRSTPRDEVTNGTVVRRLDEGINGIERAVLSFGLSVIITPLVGLVFNFTPIGVQVAPIVLALSGLTISAAAGAAVRRWKLPPENRFRMDYLGWFQSARAGLLASETQTDKVLNAILVLSVVVAFGSVSYAVATPKTDEGFTEFYLLSENETGDLVADGYPTQYVEGEEKSLFVGVDNHERERTTYVVVVELQRLSSGNDTRRVTEKRELDRFRTVLEPGESWRHEHVVRPSMVGDDLRLQYLLYRGEPPADPEADTAYRQAQLWVNVTQS